jgi:hypothetical protein
VIFRATYPDELMDGHRLCSVYGCCPEGEVGDGRADSMSAPTSDESRVLKLPTTERWIDGSFRSGMERWGQRPRRSSRTRNWGIPLSPSAGFRRLPLAMRKRRSGIPTTSQSSWASSCSRSRWSSKANSPRTGQNPARAGRHSALVVKAEDRPDPAAGTAPAMHMLVTVAAGMWKPCL